jgi:hypothetical protein
MPRTKHTPKPLANGAKWMNATVRAKKATKFQARLSVASTVPQGTRLTLVTTVVRTDGDYCPYTLPDAQVR